MAHYSGCDFDGPGILLTSKETDHFGEMSMVFHHVGVHVSNFEKSRQLYDALLDTLSIESYDLPGHIAKAWGTAACSFRIVQPPTGDISVSSSHICLTAPDEKAVKQFYETGTALGAEGAQAPNEYEDFGFRHLTAMIKDYDGNAIEAVYVNKG